MLAPTQGHNHPPGPLESAKEAAAELSAFLKEHPAFQSPGDAKEGAAWIERTRAALKEARDERDSKTKPLNEQVKAIRETYDIVREKTEKNPGGLLERAYNELKRRWTAYSNAVEAARIAELRRLQAEREQAERAAREAEAREADAMAAVDVGVCEDVGDAIVQADAAFKQYEKADRQVAVASRNVPVRVGSIMGGRSLSMRTVEVLVIEDAAAAFEALGPTEKIREAILSSARDFRKAHGELPTGISSTYERSV